MSLNPRPAKPDDLHGAVEDIVGLAYSQYESRIGRPPGPMTDDYDTLIKDDRVHVVEHDGIVQGVLVLVPEESAMLLDNVAVLPSAQGTGLGHRMMEFSEQFAREAGYRFIALSSFIPTRP